MIIVRKRTVLIYEKKQKIRFTVLAIVDEAKQIQ